ncbi:MAG: hypothetical protein HRU20_32575 [Pseudomonadales bacterium]|nr:hypothetical protein [Pseudomonadales bacterium]
MHVISEYEFSCFLYVTIPMAHLLEIISNKTIQDTIYTRSEAHSKIVERVVSAQNQLTNQSGSWSIQIKRLEVTLPVIDGVIGKNSEIWSKSSIYWLQQKEPYLHYCGYQVNFLKPVCRNVMFHGNDIILVNGYGEILVSCEVCDVASSNAGQMARKRTISKY